MVLSAGEPRTALQRSKPSRGPSLAVPFLLAHAMPRPSFRSLRNCGMLGSVTEPAIPAPGHPPEPTEPQLASAAATSSMLASPARLHLVWLLSAGAYDVGALAEHVGLRLPTRRQQLSSLGVAGIAAAGAEGRHSYYAVADPPVLRLVAQICEHIAPEGALAPDPPTGA